MDFFLLDKDVFSLNGEIVKLKKQIVQYIVFEQYHTVVLLVSPKSEWIHRNELIAIKNDYHNCKTIWTYQRTDTSGKKIFEIHSIWKGAIDGKEVLSCFINTLGFYDETNIIDVETGEIIKTEFSK